MSHSFLWATDYHGCLFKLNLATQEWLCVTSENNNNRKDVFKKVASTGKCAWAIGGDQNVYVCVFETDLPIRLQVSCYENERWSILNGWSKKSRLYTDRWHWSSKDGKQKCERENVQLPSPAWVWSGEWYIDESIECNSEGWQYAVDYPATYYRQAGNMSFVRRRKWVRQREFISFNKWIMMPKYSENDPFQDITVGGYKLPGQVDGFLSVWAITFSGKVLYRSGVSRICPEGECWTEVATDRFNLVQICVGPAGTMWGCTWDGNAVRRKGISHSKPLGTSWDMFQPPSKEDPLHVIAVGDKSVWALTKRAKVYFWRGSNKSNLSESIHRGSSSSLSSSTSSLSSSSSTKSLWVEMVGSFSAIDIGPNDQVWVVEQESQQLQFRTNVSENELSGHEWRRFNLTEVSAENAPDHIYCISSGACDVDASYFDKVSSGLAASVSCWSLASNPEEGLWRNDILKCLCERNNAVNGNADVRKLFTQQTSCREWNKRGECLYLLDKIYGTWCKCHLKLQISHHPSYSQQQPVLYIYHMNKKRSYREVVLPLKKITCVHRLKYTSKPRSIAVELCENSSKLNMVVLSMDSDTLVSEWITTLNNQDDNIGDSYTTLWATTCLGDIYKCNVIKDILAVSRYKWGLVAGHLWKVVSGANGIAWGIGFDGKPYVYIGNLQSDKVFSQQNVEEHFIYENQRWNPVEGYADRLLMSDRWHWSDESGVYQLSKQNYALPSSSKWTGDWLIDHHKNADNDGWQYAVDFPRYYHKHRGINDYVRRRRWKRSCAVSWSGPWMEVKTDVKLCDISLDMESHHDEACCCWVVSCKGDVMVRNDVTAQSPQGSSWTYIPTETPVISISAGDTSRVWCVRKDASCYLRAGFHSNKQIGTHWLHVLKEEKEMQYVYAGHAYIFALDRAGTLHIRSAVTDIYPEGTEWEPVMNNVTEVSVNNKDKVYVVQDGDVKLWVNVDRGRFDTCQLITLLKVGWTGISCRSVFYTEQAENLMIEEDLSEAIMDCVEDEVKSDNLPNGERTESSGRINPYSVDIYSFYNESNVDVESLLYEPTDSRLSVDC